MENKSFRSIYDIEKFHATHKLDLDRFDSTNR